MHQAVKLINRKPLQNLMAHDKLVKKLQNLTQFITSSETTSKHIPVTQMNQN